MSKIKEQDILKLLRGEASAKKLKALEEWSSESTANAVDLERYQLIYDESEHLASYKKVNPSKEWKKFTQTLQNSVSDDELLEYFDGLAGPAQRKKVEEWRSFTDGNKSDFDVFNLVLSESSEINAYKKVDANAEWESFSQMIKGKATPPNLTIIGATPIVTDELKSTSVQASRLKSTPRVHPSASYSTKEVPLVVEKRDEDRRTNSVFMWRTLAAAAAILLLGVFGWSIWNNAGNTVSTNENMFLTYATDDNPEVITISDGSVISLDKKTTITYFKDVALINERAITIDGKGEFDVASNPDKPFVVRAKRSGVGIRVLGTKFRLKDSEKYLEVIENIEGSVRAYSLADTNTFVIMTVGDKYGFDGVRFIELHDEYQGSEYDILYVLDYLMKESDWRVTSAPYSEFDGKAMITINLDQSYEDILEDLMKQADFEYINMDCDGCYKVTRFSAP